MWRIVDEIMKPNVRGGSFVPCWLAFWRLGHDHDEGSAVLDVPPPLSLSAEPRADWARCDGSRQTCWNISRPRIPSIVVGVLTYQELASLKSSPKSSFYFVTLHRWPFLRFIHHTIRSPLHYPFRLCTQHVTNRTAADPEETIQARRPTRSPLRDSFRLNKQALTVEFTELITVLDMTALSR